MLQVKDLKTNMEKLRIIVAIISLIAWPALAFIDWKIGICLFFILWSNNFAIKDKN